MRNLVFIVVLVAAVVVGVTRLRAQGSPAQRYADLRSAVDRSNLPAGARTELLKDIAAEEVSLQA